MFRVIRYNLLVVLFSVLHVMFQPYRWWEGGRGRGEGGERCIGSE